MRNPLSAFNYFSRNPGKVAPMGFVIVLSVFLIATIACLANSIDRTILTIYGYTNYYTYVIPQRVTARVPEDQKAIIRSDARIDRVMEASLFFTNIKTVIGSLPFVVLGLDPDNRAYILNRIGTGLTEGRMPAEGMPEAAISQPLAKNKRIKIGDIIAGPLDEGGISGSPIPVRCVGILRGPVWIAISTKSFCDTTFLAAPRSTIYTAKTPAELMAINDTMMPAHNKESGKLSPSRCQVLSRQNLIKQVRDSLSTMFLIMAVVNGTVIFVIALMSGMLSNIYFTQRIGEFAVLAAIGYQRTQLVGRILAETFLLNLIGWAIGATLTYVVLSVFREPVFEPRGLFIDPLDRFAYAYTLPIPIVITAFAVVTIGIRLLRFDPVTIIERREVA
ncbi:MAG: ABC transporter permease [Capsulimonadales bacterium]|nr:ABC transporter permease [Capsulimonadales bacterium]